MFLKTIPSNTLGSGMLERAGALFQMKEKKLDTGWVTDFPLPQLTDCCNRMEQYLAGITVEKADLQQELIQNPAFAAYLAELLSLMPDSNSQNLFMLKLDSLVGVCRDNDRDITAYPVCGLMDMLEPDNFEAERRLVFLENFLPMMLDYERWEIVILNLRVGIKIPLYLDEAQKKFLCEPFLTTNTLFISTSFEEIWDLVNTAPAVPDIFRFLFQNGICEELRLKDYQSFAGDARECYELLTSIATRLGAEQTGEFMSLWQKNICPMYELRRMEHRIMSNPEQDWAAVFHNYAGYINLLYGQRFKNLDLSDVAHYQEDVLIYAISHQKKHFIRLLDENIRFFHSLPPQSILFNRKLYEEFFNLNELTEKDLTDCGWMITRRLHTDMFTPGRLYTFSELKVLYNIPKVYVSFYHMLASESPDYRLKVLRQLLKRSVLTEDMDEPQMVALAKRLDEKPLYDWQQTDFGHIDGLTAADTVQLLIHMDELRPILPSVQQKVDVSLALQNLEILQRFDSIDALKNSLSKVDGDWRWLLEEMNLSEDFQGKYADSILLFLANNGANIARTYMESLGDYQRRAYQRVVKAELMGQLAELKYFEGDLQKELSIPISDQMMESWKNNLSCTRNELEVGEYDDFFSTMLLGIRPQKTCLSYINGAQSQCLLSSFDSNKKILYACWNNHIVGRAFLRLTKSRLTSTETQNADTEASLTFADLEDVSDLSREKESVPVERMALFLERPYISGVNPAITQQIKKMFIELAVRKADEMGVMTVLGMDYSDICPDGFNQTMYYIYISKSKAGAQYLDSLNGRAEVSAEGSYKCSRFLIRWDAGSNMQKEAA